MKFPTDPALEELVLGQMMKSPDACYSVIDILQPQSFHDYRNRTVFTAITQLIGSNTPVDLVTVTQQLKKTLKLDAIEQDGERGELFIYRLTDKVANTSNIERHVRILEENRIKRAQLSLSQEIQRSIDAGEDAFEIDEFITKMQVEMLSNIKSNQSLSAKDLTEKVREDILAAAEKKGMTGIATGFTALDKIYGGRQNGTLVVVGGRPGMGKTAYAISQAHFQSVKLKHHSLVFSLEMSDTELMKRVMSIDSGITGNKIKFGNLSSDDWQKMDHSIGRVSNSNLHIFDKAFDLMSILTIARRMKMQGKCDIVYVDYIQLVNAEGFNKEDRVSNISRAFKLLSKVLEVPVIALSQLNRGLETRGGDKRPANADLRDSGAIEQDADVIEFVYRPEQYGITAYENGNSTKGIAEIIIGKHRGGMTDTVELKWIGECTRFADPNEYIGPEAPDKGIEPNGDFDNMGFD